MTPVAVIGRLSWPTPTWVAVAILALPAAVVFCNAAATAWPSDGVPLAGADDGAFVVELPAATPPGWQAAMASPAAAPAAILVTRRMLPFPSRVIAIRRGSRLRQGYAHRVTSVTSLNQTGGCSRVGVCGAGVEDIKGANSISGATTQR